MPPLILLATTAFGQPATVLHVDDPDAASQAIKGALSGGGLTVFFIFTFVAYVLIIYLSLRLAVWPPAVVATSSSSRRMCATRLRSMPRYRPCGSGSAEWTSS